MESVKTSLAASITARAIAAALSMVALPIYLRFLGVEAYGVVGLFASLQALVVFMDFGLPTTLTRQLASVSGGGDSLAQGRDTTRSFEVAYVGLSASVGLALAALAPWVAAHWVNVQSLSVTEVGATLQLAALSLACAWPANLYTAGLAGLHRQLALALSTSLFAALRVVLSVLFLWHEATLQSFFWGQVCASLLQSAGMRWQLWRALALPGHRARACWESFRPSRQFASGMTVITITAILLGQADKVILSHLLPLAEFGAYSIAASLAAGLYVLISPVFSVIYPRISTLWATGDDAQTTNFYHACAQAMAWLVMPLAAVMACFPSQSLYVLTDDRAIATQAGPALALMVIAAACNGIMNPPYALQLAAGWTSLSVWINLGALVVLAPAMWWASSRYGATGGAAAWAALNAGYVLLTPHLLHRRLLPHQKWRWYRADVVVPALVSGASALLLARLVPLASDSRLAVLAGLAACWALVAALTFLSLGVLRTRVRRSLRR